MSRCESLGKLDLNHFDFNFKDCSFLVPMAHNTFKANVNNKSNAKKRVKERILRLDKCVSV